MPHNSSGYSSGFGRRVGSRSICQSSTPFTDRAAHRCESPRRSSTRQSSSVEPSGRSVAPALKTLLMEYGQSFPVKMGLAGCLRNSVSYCFVVVLIESFTVLMGSLSQLSAKGKDGPRQVSKSVFCAIGLFERAHLQEGHQKGQRGFRSLIFIGSVGVEAISTAASRRIVECDLEIVVSQEPVHC